MRPDSEEYAIYRADARAFLEFCQDNHVRAPLSERALTIWLIHLTLSDVHCSEIERKQTALETLFRHIGILPEDELEGDALTDQETAPRE